MKRAQGINLWSPRYVVDRRPGHELWSTVLGAAIGIDDDRSFARERLEDRALNGADHGFYRAGIVVGRQTDEEVDFPNRD